MARKQGKADESASADVWTNVSQNPVILGDGSSVGAGEQTTSEQAEFAKGSFWEEHGVLVSGAPVLSGDGAGQIGAMSDEIEWLRSQLLEANVKVEAFQTEASRLQADLDGEISAARDFQIEHEQLKAELEGLKAENEGLKAKATPAK